MKKTTLFLHSLHDHTGICRYLEKEAAQGWVLEDTNLGCWHFHAAPPQKLRYAVTYFEDADPFQPSGNQRNYYDLCAAAGWELASNHGTMQIFRTADENAVPIETEPLVQVENIHRCVKKYMWNRIFWALLIMVNMILRLRFYTFLPEQDSVLSYINILSAATVLATTGHVLSLTAEAVSYFHWRAKALTAAETEDRFFPSHSALWTQVLPWVLYSGLMAVYAVGVQSPLSLLVLGMTAAILAYAFLSNAVKNRLARQGKQAGHWANITVNVSIVVLAAFFITLLCSRAPSSENQIPRSNRRVELLWSEDLALAPLTPADLGPWDEGSYGLKIVTGTLDSPPLEMTNYSFRKKEQSSPEGPETFQYTLWTGTEEATLLKQEQLQVSLLQGNAVAEGDLSPVDCGCTYALHISSGDSHDYLFRWDSTLAWVEFPEALTPEQLTAALNALRQAP